jgi:sugar lactone lactonase YvrE
VADWSARTIWPSREEGSFVTLAARHEGKKLNSANDVVVRSDGLIYFHSRPDRAQYALAIAPHRD